MSRDPRQGTEALLAVSPAIDQSVGGILVGAIEPRRIDPGLWQQLQALQTRMKEE
jgi:hypothetical protein